MSNNKGGYDIMKTLKAYEKENAELKDDVSELSSALREACEIEGAICSRFKMIYLSLVNKHKKLT